MALSSLFVLIVLIGESPNDPKEGSRILIPLEDRNCGPNCLYFLSQLLGKSLAQEDIQRVVPTSKKGASLAEIAAGARALGVRLAIVHEPLGRIENLPVPAIVHFSGAHENIGHFSVLLSVDNERCRILDGTTGQKTFLYKGDFRRYWTGYALVSQESWQSISLARALEFGALLVTAIVYAALVFGKSRPNGAISAQADESHLS